MPIGGRRSGRRRAEGTPRIGRGPRPKWWDLKTQAAAGGAGAFFLLLAVKLGGGLIADSAMDTSAPPRDARMDLYGAGFQAEWDALAAIAPQLSARAKWTITSVPDGMQIGKPELRIDPASNFLGPEVWVECSASSTSHVPTPPVVMSVIARGSGRRAIITSWSVPIPAIPAGKTITVSSIRLALIEPKRIRSLTEFTAEVNRSDTRDR